MGIWKWLQIGISLFLAFETPRVSLSPDAVAVSLEMENILTGEMRDLLVHGVDFQFELYCSLSAVPAGPAAAPDLRILRTVRRMSYDFLEGRYRLLEDGRPLYDGADLEAMIREGRMFSDLRFALPTAAYARFSLFAQVRLLEDPTLRRRMGMDIGDLWVGYRPSIKHEFTGGGVP